MFIKCLVFAMHGPYEVLGWDKGAVKIGISSYDPKNSIFISSKDLKLE